MTTAQTNRWVMEDIVVLDPAGTVYNDNPCGENTPFGTIEVGEEPKVLYPAPEKLPHVITLEDVTSTHDCGCGKKSVHVNKSLQSKLQANFDTLERTSLSLNPDSGERNREGT